MSRVPALISRTHRRLRTAAARLSLGWKIYLSLAAIILPVFALMLFVQTQVTRPILEEEVRQIGTSVCHSLATDIIASHLLAKPEQLEARLIEVTWPQPSIARLDVIVKENDVFKVIASNIVEDNPSDFSTMVFDDAGKTELRHEESRGYWEIVYPIRERNRTVGWIHAEVSLQLVVTVVGIFSKIALMTGLLTIVLLIGLLSTFLRRMIENERRLRKAESENIELMQQLHETQRQLFLNEKLAIMGQLTASFAHEIGTPLNSLSGHLQLLHDEVKGHDSQRRLEVISSQVARIEGIVKEFLTSTHAPPQQKQLVDIKALIERITTLVAPRMAALKAEVDIDVGAAVPPLRAVPTDLEQVLLNLTNNAMDALEASPNARELRFEARCRDEAGRPTLELRVTDTGEGIAPGALKQVLKPFFTTKAPGQGTGLGLTISQRLVKRYGGRLDLESTLGKGTTIKVSIPYDAT